MADSKTVPLLKVHQWLPNWNRIHWRDGLEKPANHFFVGTMSLKDLRYLAAVTVRDIKLRANPNVAHGYQRQHEDSRSRKIHRYIQNGYPLSTSAGLSPDEHEHLINPGWLPNAIIINLIPAGEVRVKAGREVTVPKELELKLKTEGEHATLTYPSHTAVERYSRKGKPFYEPIEIIDGQHRVFSIDWGDDLTDNYQVPVVIFNNLSLGWQAYLFWTINVEPKKINPSLAFDLYPELRRQEWLERSEVIRVYQEHRAQELVEILWSHPQSPWRNRIELHGRRVKGHVSNAAFIRSLTASFIKRWATNDRVGGLFGSVPPKTTGKHERVIPWNRTQQAAFLIIIWKEVAKATKECRAEWAQKLAQGTQSSLLDDLPPAFAGEHSLLATDQGVRAIHNLYNAIFQHLHEELNLATWSLPDELEDPPSEETITRAIDDFNKKMPTAKKIAANIAQIIINRFDWRLSSAPELSEAQSRAQAAYRGSGGYSLMMKDLLQHLSSEDIQQPLIRSAARDLTVSLIRHR